MLIGMSTSNYYGKLTTEESMEHLCKLGIRDFEVFLQTPSEYTDEFIDILLSIKEKYNAEIHSLHALGTQFEPQLFAEAYRQKADALKVYTKLMKCAQRLGAGVYVMHGPARLKRKKYILNYKILGKISSELAEIASDFNVKLTWENVHWAFYSEPEFAYYLLDNCTSDNVYFTLDIKQAMQAGHLAEEYIEATRGRIVNVHVCDYNDTVLCLPGQGSFDFQSLFQNLKKNGYSGPVIEEVYCPDIKDDACLVASYDYLRALASCI